MERNWFNYKREKVVCNKYDMRLLKKLNREYKDHPMQETSLEYTEETQLVEGKRRIANLCKNIDFKNKKVLEIGGGAGYSSYAVSELPVEQVVCTDIYENEQWDNLKNDKLIFKQVDLSIDNPFDEQEFDIIFSFVAWEHMKHPYEVLQQAARVLKDGGTMYIFANLYRAPNASHLYRTIFFPWPHLLFDKEIVKKYALSNGVEQWFIDAFYDLNKLTYAQYKEYFDMLHLEIVSEKKSIIPLDLEFYERFEDKLGLYPISDLETSFFEVYLRKIDTVPITKKIVAYKPEIKLLNGNEYKIDADVELSIQATGIDLEYAWYVFCNGERIDTFWYDKKPCVSYKFKKAGEYYMVCFVRDQNGQTANYFTKKIQVID